MKKDFQVISSQFSEARTRLARAIRDLPDSAGGIKMLGKNCGIVPFSMIASHGFNLNAHYYITMETKRVLLETLEANRSVDSTVAFIEGILATGKLKCKGYVETIAPNVLEALKKAWEGL
jgi:hypothetical protein